MKKRSKTDWARLQKMNDQAIDTSDVEELDEDFLRRAEIRMPVKKSVTIRIDEDVLLWFKSQGKGYQTRINRLLRTYMEGRQE